jgi:hypothetical protein
MPEFDPTSKTALSASPNQTASVLVHQDVERPAQPSAIQTSLIEPLQSSMLGNIWWWRLPLWLLMVYVFFQHLHDTLYTSFLGGLNLGVHELGHLVFTAFGTTIMVMGGTFWQCAVPVIAAVMFLRQKDWFALTFALFWFSTNLFGIAVYIADSRAQVLDYVSYAAGDNTIHDWEYMLTKLHLLNQDIVLGQFVRFAGILTMLTSLVLGAYVLFLMWQANRNEQNNDVLSP